MSRNSVPTNVPIPVLVLAFALLQFLSGCGGGRPPVEPAKGKVVCNGQPVTVGSVVFVPIGDGGSGSGRPATGSVGPDGTFVMTTYEHEDGAAVGKHRVEYAGPEEEGKEDEEGEAPPEGSPAERARNAERIRQRQAQQKLQYVLKGEMIVEVKADGENDFTIEVIPAGMAQASNEGVSREE
jgi:hypothetical protein